MALDKHLLIVIAFITAEGLLNIALGTCEFQIEHQMQLYGLLALIMQPVHYYGNHFKHVLGNIRSIEYQTKAWQKYVRINQESREKDSVEHFNSLLDKASRAIGNRYTWMLGTITSVTSYGLHLLYIFVVRKQTTLLLTMIAINVAWYYLFTRYAVKDVATKRKVSRKVYPQFMSKAKLFSQRIHNGETDDYRPLMKAKESIHQNDQDSMNAYIKSTKIQKFPNEMIYVLIPFITTDTLLFPQLFIAFNNFNRALSSMSSFMNEIQIMQGDIQAVEDFWSGKIFTNKPMQQKIPQKVTISGSVNDIVSVKQITIKKGDHVRIVGETGSGKTTFVKGLVGWITGLCADKVVDMQMLTDDIVLMRQNVREITPFEKITIRELFYDEPSDDKIIQYLKETNAFLWFNTRMKSKLDEPICNSISGGEKTKLCLAIALYKMNKVNSSWLILDEPEQGIDTEQLPQLFQGIFEKYRDKTILIITHMCDCQARQLGITKKLEIKDGQAVADF